MKARLVASDHSLVVVEPDDKLRDLLERRLRAQGYRVLATASPAEAASMALADPPSAVIARLMMPGISGVQLCHLLKAEAATAHVAVVLLGDGYTPRNQFWAEQSGASYARSGAMGELLRTVSAAIGSAPTGDGFFTMLGAVDVRDRIAAELDRRLFESMLAAEVRALAASESFDRLFDQLSQLACRQLPYGWLALLSEDGDTLAVHAHPATAEEAVTAAMTELDCAHSSILRLLDEDARQTVEDDQVVAADVCFGETVLGRLALSAALDSVDATGVVHLIARELGVPLRVVNLVETTRRQAGLDPLTGLLNRRAFLKSMAGPDWTQRPYVLCMLDVDHFKLVNDTHGHGTGDVVLKSLGRVLKASAAQLGGLACRWGGEEFLLTVPGAPTDDGEGIGERLRVAVAELELRTPEGLAMPIRASVGVARSDPGQAVEDVVNLADDRLYSAKEAGRNQVRAA